MSQQRGFTLISVVVVILILGALAAVVVPRFSNQSSEDLEAAAKRVGSTIESGSSMNYAQRVAGNASATVINQANVCDATLLTPFAPNLALVNAAPTSPRQFQILPSPRAGANASCAASSGHTTAECGVQTSGSGGQVVAFSVFCAR